MRRYKAFLFDCDGTLLDSEAPTVEAFDLLAKEVLGRSLTAKEREECFHRPSLESLEALGIARSSENIERLNRYYVQGQHRIALFQGLEPVLKRLKSKNFPMGMASNRDEAECRFAMEFNGLGAYLMGFTCRDYARAGKPSGEMITEFLNRFRLEPEGVLMIGNAAIDAMAAKDAGIDYAHCRWGCTEDMLDGRESIIDRPADLLHLAETSDQDQGGYL